MSSTNFGSILIFASGVVVACNVLCARVFYYGRGHIVMLKIKHIYRPDYIYTSIHILHKKHFKDISREFDEFQVNIHFCKLRCWYL